MGDSSVVEISSDSSSSYEEASSESSDVESSSQEISSSDDDSEYESDRSDIEGEAASSSFEQDKKEDSGKSKTSDETEEARYGKVMKMLAEGGDLNGLRLEDCKAYLRKHGLRISGTKSICVMRIHEHMNIKDGGGEKLYPKSSFVINCKGDVCTGDVVLFKQKVYEKYDLASRGGAQTPIGMRTIAGRVVKDSYGGLKQQHTFTVEVLWSRGVKPLAPLNVLLIKGRNLYRLRIYRRPWPNEAERVKVLEEKHARGDEARITRAAAKGKHGRKFEAHKSFQNSNGLKEPSKRRKPMLQKSSFKKAKFSMMLSSQEDKTQEKSTGRPTSLAAPARDIAVCRAPLTLSKPTQNSNTGNVLHRQQMEVASRKQIMHQYPANRPALSYPFPNTRSLTTDPYRNPLVQMPFNPVRNDNHMSSTPWGPQAEMTYRSGVIPPPQVYVNRAHSTRQPDIPAPVSTIKVHNSTPLGSSICSFSGCRAMGARNCANSACSQCCRKVGRRCKRHKT